MNKFWQWATGRFTPENDPYGSKEEVPVRHHRKRSNTWIVLYFKRKALEEQKKIETLDPNESQKLKSEGCGWIRLYFKRKALEEKQKIEALEGKRPVEDK